VSQAEYNASGSVNKTINPRDKATMFEHDVLDRVVKTVNALGFSSRQAYGPDGEVTLSVNARGAETRFHFDRLGRLDETTNPLGGKVKKSFDEVGNLVRVEDEEHHAWAFAYDLLGRRIRETDPNGGTTHYTFNALELVKVRHADGSEWQYNHDPASGPLTSRVLRDRTGAIEDVESFSYNVLGNRTRAENGAVKVTSTFDIMQREVKRTTLWKKTSAVRELAFSWDALGRRQAMSDSHGRVTRYSYDKLSRPVKIAVNEPNPRSTSVADAYFKREYAFAWDPNSNLTQVDYPNGTRTRRVFDDIDRLTTLVHERVTGPNTAETLASWEIKRDENGNPVKVTREGGEVWSFEHDPLDRLVQAHLPRELVARLRAKDPAKGNEKDEDGDRDEDDCADRLLARSGSGNVTYKFDAAGNRTEENIGGRVISSTFNAANEMLTRGTMRFGYDPRGNQIDKVYKSGRRDVFGYSVAGKLASFSTGHGNKPDKLKDVERYFSGPGGDRVLVEDVQGGQLTHALWMNSRPIEEWHEVGHGAGKKDKGEFFTRDLGGQLLETAKYTRRAGRSKHECEDEDWDDWDADEDRRGGDRDEGPRKSKLNHVRWAHGDFLGSTALVTNHCGRVLDRLQAGPFGEMLEGNYARVKFGFTGHRLEARTGHWSAVHRSLDPRAGRWTQRDPIGFRGGLNPYRYVGDAPFSSVDPLGLLALLFYGGSRAPRSWETDPHLGMNQIKASLAGIPRIGSIHLLHPDDDVERGSQLVKSVPASEPVFLVGHSNGALAALQVADQFGGDVFIGRGPGGSELVPKPCQRKIKVLATIDPPSALSWLLPSVHSSVARSLNFIENTDESELNFGRPLWKGFLRGVSLSIDNPAQTKYTERLFTDLGAAAHTALDNDARVHSDIVDAIRAGALAP
jgi:RHS repeat-associated protein